MTEPTYDWNQRRTRRQQPTTAAPAIQPITVPPGDIHPYGQAALTGELDQLLATTEGGRNDQLNRATYNLAQLVASGHLQQAQVDQQLRAAALHIGLTPTEVEATLRSGQRAGQQQPRDVPELAINVTEVPVLQIAASSSPTSNEGENPATDRTSWWPRPIGQRAADAKEEPAPTHLVRDDGQPLFYSGKVNGLIGESESGKSWVALLAIVQAIGAGQRVLLHDFEDSPGSIHGRLNALGATPDQLQLLAYANPDEALGLAQTTDLSEALQEPCALIVVDGVNAAMTLLGYDLNSNTDATLFNRKLLKPLASTGACVITVDHVPKNSDNRGKGGIGAQAKRAMMDGCCLSVEVVEPFGKGQSGTLKLLVDKDRPGHVRGASSGSVLAGRAHLDSVGDQVRMHVEQPDLRSAEERGPWRPTGLMEKVSRLLERAEQPMSGNEIYEAVRGRKQVVLQAVAELVAGGHIAAERRTGRGGGDAYRSIQMFREIDSSEVVPTGSQPVPGTGFETGSRSRLPLGAGTSSTDEPERQTTELVPVDKQPGLDMPDGHSNCNRCGATTPDAVLDETAGYCQPCGRVMNP